jgi:hypothetical protein
VGEGSSVSAGRGEVRVDVGGARDFVNPLATRGGDATIGRDLATEGDMETGGIAAAGGVIGEVNREGETRAEVVSTADAGS